MASEGHEIGCHTLNHFDLTKIPIKKANSEILNSKKFLADNDLITKGICSFAYPYYKYNDQLTATLQPLFIAARSGNPHYNQYNFPIPENFYALNSFSPLSKTNFEQMKKWIETTETGNKWLIFTFHGIDDHNQWQTISSKIYNKLFNYTAELKNCLIDTISNISAYSLRKQNTKLLFDKKDDQTWELELVSLSTKQTEKTLTIIFPNPKDWNQIQVILKNKQFTLVSENNLFILDLLVGDKAIIKRIL